MFKKTMVVLFAAMILVAGLSVLVMAQDKPVPTTTPTTTPERVVKPAVTGEKAVPVKEVVKTAPVKEKAVQTAKEEKPKAMPIRPGLHKNAANMVGVCSCGMTFTPSATTKYFAYNGKEYGTCSDGCYENDIKDPAGAVKKIDENMAKMMSPAMTK
jgi:hypothetical protein